MSSLIAGKYEVREELATSPVGTTYRVRHTLLDSVLSLTVLPADLGADAERLARVQRAVRSAFELKHERIIRVLDFGCADDRYHLVDAYVEGQTLEQVLRERGALPPAEALQIAWQLADALAYAHERGVVHGAITPTTVLLERAAVPHAMITGFVVAEVAEVESGRPSGLARYAAPEQLLPAEGAKPDPRSDIFALGMLLFEMLEGRAFFAGLDESQIVDILRDASTPLLPRFSRILPSGVSAVAARAMRRVAAERQQGMAQLRREIDACLQRLDRSRSDLPVVHQAEAAATPPPPPARPAGNPTAKVKPMSLAAVATLAPATDASSADGAPPTPPVERKVVRLGLVEDFPPAPEERPETMSAERVVARSLLAAAAGQVKSSRRRVPVASGALMMVVLVLGWAVLRPARKAPAARAVAPSRATAPSRPAAKAAPLDVVASVPPMPGGGASVKPEPGAPARATERVVAPPSEPAEVQPRRTERHLPPRIAGTRPPSGKPVSVLEGEAVEFSVRATDRNADDRLSYAWFLDGQRVSEQPSWRFVAPRAATGPAHEVEVKVTDASGLKAPRLSWNVVVKARMSELNVREWLGRLASAWERGDAATLQLYGVSEREAREGGRRWFWQQKRRVTFRNETISTERQYATVTVDRVELDVVGKIVSSQRQSFDLEKQPNGFIALRTR